MQIDTFKKNNFEPMQGKMRLISRVCFPGKEIGGTNFKFHLKMKLAIVFFTVCFLNVQANAYSQQITLSAKNIPVQQVFKSIEKQTGYVVFYNMDLLQNLSPISVSAKKMKLNDFLDKIFEKLPLAYSIKRKTIVVYEENKSPKRTSFAATAAIVKEEEPQANPIEGYVISEDGIILEGATVAIKGTKTGTQTDKKGFFSIEANVGDVIVVSFVGYESQEFTVRNTNVVTIRLKSTDSEMKSIVVTGIFQRSAASYTGAANTITSDDIRKAGNQNVLQVLSILDPAVQIPQDILNGADPNKTIDMRLRGASSLPISEDVSELSTSNIRSEKDFYSAYGKQVDDIKNTYSANPNLPLFILDGFEAPISKINDLDINRIQSITILKDASATAIYGSRGANGVIVVERFKPKEGDIRIDYKADITFTFPDLHDYHLLDAREKLEVETLADIYSSSYTDMDLDLKRAYNEKYKEVLKGRDTWWPAVPLHNTIGQRHGVTLEGGSRGLTFGADFSYNRTNGVMKGSSRSAYNGSVFFNYRTKKFLLNNRLSVQSIDAINSKWGSFSQYVRMNPYFSPFDEKGNIPLLLQSPLTDLQTAVYGRVYNPVFNTTLNGKDFRKSKNLTNNTALTYYFTPEFSLRGRLSVTYQNDDNEVFLPAEHTTFQQMGTDIFTRGSYTAGYGKLNSYDANVDLNYNLTRGKHQVFSTLSSRANQVSTENVVVQVNGLPSALTDYVFYGRNYVGDRPSGSESTIRTVGFLGNVNYTFDNRYFVDFSYRLDGASSVGADKTFSPFWSVGAGWNLHNEKIFSGAVQSGKISQLRLRASTGLTGAQQFDPYMAYRTYNYFLDEAYLNSIGASLLSIGNDELTWQGTKKYNVGTDITLFNNRLSITGDYYSDFTDKFIADFNLPPSTGFPTYKGNLGSIRSKGWEVRASYQVIRGYNLEDFSLTLMGNIGSNQSTIKKISNELKAQNDKLQSLNTTTSPFLRYEEGASMDAIWVVPSLGIDPATGRELFLKKDGSTTFIWDAADMVPAGVSTPKYRGNAGVSMIYNGFQLNAYFSYRFGGQMFNQTLLDRIENVNLVDNADKRVLTDRWKEPGDVSFFKTISVNGSSTNASSRFVQDDNSLELASVSLLYRLNQEQLKNSRFKQLSFGIYMNDVFRLSSISVERGIDYPFARSFSVSIQAGF